MDLNAVDMIFKAIIVVIGGAGTLIAWFAKRTLDDSVNRIATLEKKTHETELDMVKALKSIEVSLERLNTYVEGFSRYGDLIAKLEDRIGKLEQRITDILIHK